MHHIKKFGRLSRSSVLKTPQWTCFNPNLFKTLSINSYQSSYFSTAEQTADKSGANSEILSVLNSESTNIFRNIAIIAHVDHGKTTLVDSLIKHSGAGDGAQSMDSNQLEKEKGITILSKCTGVTYKGYKINIVDTPGHHDFGGEVERIMNMVDGVALVVCAVEGPMTQTKFVLQKALKQKLKPMVIINKVDRPGARVKEVENEVFDLFCNLECSDDLLEYPVFYASGKAGWAVKNLDGERKDMSCILDAIVDHIPAPKVDVASSFAMLVSQTESHTYFGKLLIGRINSGTVKVGDKINSVDVTGKTAEANKVFKILRRYGMSQIEMNRAVAGDIVSIAGFTNATVNHTLNEPGKYTVIPVMISIPIDPPMLSISVNVNTSPLVGKEGTKVAANHIKERLVKESENDVALRFSLGDKDSGGFEIQGRGDLHLGVLIEKMRREGYEMAITPPSVVMKKEGSKILEPVEKLTIEVGHVYIPGIIEAVTDRKGNLISSDELNSEKHRIVFSIPTRGLIGLRSQFLNETKGTVVMTTEFFKYEDYKGPLKKNVKGALISSADGICTAYGLKELEAKGTLFIKPGMRVYNGMVIGEHLKDDDIELNPTKEKKLTNVRSVGSEEKIMLSPPRIFTLEDAISYVRDDEIIEVTPENIRIRKKELDPTLRKKQRRENRNERFKFAK